jgi:hypothetical protein
MASMFLCAYCSILCIMYTLSSPPHSAWRTSQGGCIFTGGLLAGYFYTFIFSFVLLNWKVVPHCK